MAEAHTAIATAGTGKARTAKSHTSRWRAIGKDFVHRLITQDISMIAAGIGFYGMLSIFPAIGALVSVYGLVANPAELATSLAGMSFVPSQVLDIITTALKGLATQKPSSLNWALLLSIGLALWSARAGMGALMSGLDEAFDVDDQRSFIMRQVTAIGLTIGALAFGAVALASVAALPAFIAAVPADDTLKSILQLARWPLLAAITVTGFSLVYRFAPGRKPDCWRFASPGTLLASALWLAGSWGFSFYVSWFGSYDATYGSLGAVVVLLLWLWLSALALLVGAQLDAAIDANS